MCGFFVLLYFIVAGIVDTSVGLNSANSLFIIKKGKVGFWGTHTLKSIKSRLWMPQLGLFLV